MSSPIRAILFDVGGVLVRTFDPSGRQAWEQRLGLPPGGAEAVVLNSEMGHRAQRGEIGE
jgi:phosphoglycolate phosphatase-like HAD superfamily hydrolase